MGLMKKILYKMAGTSEELEQLYAEKGYCDEYIESYMALHKKLKPMDYITLADIYISLERYDEAEEALGHVKVGLTTDNLIKGLYLQKRMELFVMQKKPEEAMAVLAKEQKFLDIYFSAPAYKRYAIMYYDSAAVTLAMNGQLEAAGRYYQLEIQSSETYDKSGIHTMLTNVHMLKAMGNDAMAEEAADKAREFIESYSEYRFPWQKKYFTDLIDRYMK